MATKPVKFPSFCTTDQDRDAYLVAVKGKYHKYVTSPADLLAIRQGCWFDLALPSG